MSSSRASKEKVRGICEGPVSFEDALDATGMGRYNYGVLLLCGCMLVAMAFESLSVSILLPASACELLTTPAQQGLIAATPLVGLILCSHVWGYLADTRGRRRILTISLAIGSVAGFLSAFSPNWIVFVFFKFISCSAVSGTNALTFTLLSEFMPRSYRNSMTLVSMSMFMMSQGLLAVVSMPVLPLEFSYYVGVLGIYINSWRLLTMLYSMPCLLCALVVCKTAESPKFLYSWGRTDEAMDILRRMYAVNNGSDTMDFPVKSFVPPIDLKSKQDDSMWTSIVNQTVPLVRAPYLRSTIILGGLYVVVFFCGMTYIAWLPTMADMYSKAMARGEEGLTFCEMMRSSNNFARQEPDISGCSLNQEALVLVLIVRVIFTVLNLAMGGLVEKVGRRRLLLLIPVVSSAAGLALNFVTQAVLSVTLFVTYLSSIISMGLLTALTVQVYPTHLRAMAVCLTLMLGRGSAVAGVNILKRLLDEDCETSFYVFGSITLPILVMIVLLTLIPTWRYQLSLKVGAVIALFLPPDGDTGAESGAIQRPAQPTGNIGNEANKQEIPTIA